MGTAIFHQQNGHGPSHKRDREAIDLFDEMTSQMYGRWLVSPVGQECSLAQEEQRAETFDGAKEEKSSTGAELKVNSEEDANDKITEVLATTEDEEHSSKAKDVIDHERCEEPRLCRTHNGWE
ncbi:hypothetical protein HPB50_002529 [Hyalomma asiaticum]|uniref:Uncharacterized protein n=1 Tax=Hyalomma asiaticum TaxID=266040 RepID=A0ACB7TB74_HYAAI|nr:hypothetical protein HPB50_002529 [Hyalomma asiaticum]